jgi:hypothetical protein
VIARAGGMPVGQLLEMRNDRVAGISDAPIAADQIRIVVAQRHAARRAAVATQIEEDRGAADERLEVAAVRGRIEAAQDRQQLPLTADPLEKRANARSFHDYDSTRAGLA